MKIINFRVFQLLSLIMIWASLIFSCKFEDSEPEEGGPLSACIENGNCSFTNDILPRLNEIGCPECHGGTTPTAGFTITDYNQVSSRLTPGDGKNSLIYIKADSGGMWDNATIVGGGDSSGIGQIQWLELLAAWIDQGANQ